MSFDSSLIMWCMPGTTCNYTKSTIPGTSCIFSGSTNIRGRRAYLIIFEIEMTEMADAACDKTRIFNNAALGNGIT